MLVLLLSPSTAAADTLSDLQLRINQARQKLGALTSRKQGQQGVVNELRGVSNTYAGELRKVDQDLLAAVSKLRQAEDGLAKVEAEQAALEDSIAEKEAAVEQRAGVYGTRLRALYKFTRTSPLEQLLAARDFSDAMRRMTMMQAVTRVDNRLLGQLRSEHDDLLRAREALAHKKAEAVTLRDEIETQRQSLAATRTVQAALLAQAQQEQFQAEATLSQLDQTERALRMEIPALQAQYQTELAEIERQRVEAQRRAEEQRRQAAAQATAQAQAAAQATAAARAAAAAQATAQAAARTSPARGGAGQVAASATKGPAARATPVMVAGSVNTSGLSPSSAGLIWPVSNPVITTEFGERTFAQPFHTGLDLAQDLYTPIRAASDGIVLKQGLAVPGNRNASYGMMVVIGHSPTLSTLYAHMDDKKLLPVVKQGDRVGRGQLIGYIGMTGITSGPHLHFEVLLNNDPKNPRLYLPK